MDAERLTSCARRAAARPLPLFGRWLRRRAISALLADGSGAGMNAVIEALPTWSGAERDWLLMQIVAYASVGGRDAVFQHFLRRPDPDLCAMLVAWAYAPKDAAHQALLFFLTGQWQRYQDLDVDHSLLREAYEAADAALRHRIMDQATRHGRQEWVTAAVCAAWAKSRDAALGGIIAEYQWVASAPPELKVLTALHVGQFEQLRDLGPLGLRALLDATADRDLELARRARQILAQVERLEDRESLCEHFFRHPDPDVGALLVAWAYAPREAAHQALLFFLTGQWQRYEDIDVDHSLLRVAYEAADPALRRHITDQAVRHGRQEWLGMGAGSLSGERLGQMSTAEWETVLQVLSAAQNHRELWRLAQEAPPRWSKRLLDALGDWPLQQAPERDRAQLARLLQYAAACPLEVRGALTQEIVIRGGWHNFALAKSRDGTLLAGMAGGIAHLWRLPYGTPLATLNGNPYGGESCLAMSPDATLLASGCEEPIVRLWRLPDGVQLAALKVADYGVLALAISPDGAVLAATCGLGVRLWELPGGTWLATLREGCGPLAFTPDGMLLASGGADYSVRLWRLPDRAPLAILIGHINPIKALAISPDSTLLASASSDATVRLWRLPIGTPLATLPGHTHEVQWLAISPDGTMLTSASCDSVRLWHLPDGAPLGTLKASTDGERILGMSQDGSLLASCPLNGGPPVRLRSLTLPLASVPIGAIDAAKQAWLSEQLQGPRASPAERRWLEFIAALIRWRRRN
jgi:hypothetical protein